MQKSTFRLLGLSAILVLAGSAVYGVETASSTMLAQQGTPALGEYWAAVPPEMRFNLVTLGTGGLAGWAVGFTLKKFAKLAAIIVGISFLSLQLLAFNHFITIDWERIKAAVPDESIENSGMALMSAVTYNIPFAGTFLVGFWMGFRKG